MKTHLISLTIKDYRRLLTRNQKSEIIKVKASGTTLSDLLPEISIGMSCAKNPKEMLLSVETPCAALLNLADFSHFLQMIMEPYKEFRPALTWGITEDSESALFRAVIYVV